MKRIPLTNWIGTGFILASLVACSDEVSFDSVASVGDLAAQQEHLQQGEATTDGSPQEKIKDYSQSIKQQVELRKVDILMVVDNSASMADEQLLIGSQLHSFISHIEESDWQIGVVTTDVLAGEGQPGFSGELDTVSGLLDRRYLLPSDQLKNELFLNLIQRDDNCGQILSNKTCSSNSEQPLQALIQSINKRERANKGFFRDGADLVVVMISDEDELSTGDSKATKPDQVIRHVQAVFPNKKLTAYGVIIEPGDEGCYLKNISRNAASYGTHVKELVEKTQGLTFSICSTNYGAELKAISKHMKKRLLVDSLILDHVALKETLDVEFINSSKIKWTYDGKNKIQFVSPLPEGAEVKVKYKYKETL